MKGLGQVTPPPTSATDLYGLDAELQHLVAGRAGEVDVDAGQRGEHQLLGQLVDQRHAQALLQVHQHLGNRGLQRAVAWDGWVGERGGPPRTLMFSFLTTEVILY